MGKIKIALLGIDGSGKSTIANELKIFFEKQGYDVKIVPFHKWVFADIFRDKLKLGKVLDTDRKSRNTPYAPSEKSLSSYIKPPIAFIDNVLFYLMNRPSKRKQIYIYDRFVCATQIKLRALNYNTDWFKPFWWNIAPDYTFIFDIDADKSINRQKDRGDRYVYRKHQLQMERILYREYAIKHSVPLIRCDAQVPDILKRVLHELRDLI